MTQREKKLAIGFAAVIVFWFGKNTVNEWFVQPIQTRKSAIENAQEKVDTQQVAKSALDTAAFQMQVATMRGLPYDEDTAERIYLEWDHRPRARVRIQQSGIHRGPTLFEEKELSVGAGHRRSNRPIRSDLPLSTDVRKRRDRPSDVRSQADLRRTQRQSADRDSVFGRSARVSGLGVSQRGLSPD